VEFKLLDLAFGGYSGPATGATEEYDGSTWTNSGNSLNTARTHDLAGCWNSNSSFSFWWLYWYQLLQEQQKNMMEIVGQLLQ
jgi:hypothetical protein